MKEKIKSLNSRSNFCLPSPLPFVISCPSALVLAGPYVRRRRRRRRRRPPILVLTEEEEGLEHEIMKSLLGEAKEKRGRGGKEGDLFILTVAAAVGLAGLDGGGGGKGPSF